MVSFLRIVKPPTKWHRAYKMDYKLITSSAEHLMLENNKQYEKEKHLDIRLHKLIASRDSFLVY